MSRGLLAVSSFRISAPRDGANLRASELLRELARDRRVRLVAPGSEEDTEAIRALGVSRFTPVALQGRWTFMPYQYDASPLVRAVADELSSDRPDAVLLWTGTEFLARELADFPPSVADRIDCASLGAWQGFRASSGVRGKLDALIDLRRILRYERRVAGTSYATVVVGESDERWLRRVVGEPDVRVIPNGVRVGPEVDPKPETDLPTIVFSGVMNYEPNMDAARYFAARVLPLVRRQLPAASFVIVGRDPGPAILELGKLPGVDVRGEVPSLQAELARAWVAVAPMRLGAGIKNKVLEAWSVGTPVVMTRRATNGLPAAQRMAALVADRPRAMAAAIVGLLRDPKERRRLGRAAYEAARESSWEVAGRRMSDLLDEAVRERRAS